MGPARVFRRGEEELAGQAEDELPDYYVPILAAGVRPEFEMEQVDPGDLDPGADGPILEAVYARDTGDPSRAEFDILERKFTLLTDRATRTI